MRNRRNSSDGTNFQGQFCVAWVVGYPCVFYAGTHSGHDETVPRHSQARLLGFGRIT